MQQWLEWLGACSFKTVQGTRGLLVYDSGARSLNKDKDPQIPCSLKRDNVDLRGYDPASWRVDIEKGGVEKFFKDAPRNHWWFFEKIGKKRGEWDQRNGLRKQLSMSHGGVNSTEKSPFESSKARFQHHTKTDIGWPDMCLYRSGL